MKNTINFKPIISKLQADRDKLIKERERIVNEAKLIDIEIEKYEVARQIIFSMLEVIQNLKDVSLMISSNIQFQGFTDEEVREQFENSIKVFYKYATTYGIELPDTIVWNSVTVAY